MVIQDILYIFYFRREYENILAILQQETPRDVILYLIENPGATQSEIVRHKGFTAPTINWHMSRLIEIGLVYSCKEGRFVKYLPRRQCRRHHHFA